MLRHKWSTSPEKSRVHLSVIQPLVQINNEIHGFWVCIKKRLSPYCFTYLNYQFYCLRGLDIKQDARANMLWH